MHMHDATFWHLPDELKHFGYLNRNLCLEE